MENIPVSIITPIRDRSEMIKVFENNIKNTFANYELIYVEQDDDKLFMKGQLINLGAKEAKHEVLVIHDVDILHENTILINKSIVEINKMILPFTHIKQIDPKTKKELQCDERLFSFGGVQIITKEFFNKINGYSNLFYGWGGEDNDFAIRARHIRYKNTILHLFHGGLQYQKNKGSEHHNHNVLMLTTERAKESDGMKQTTAETTITRTKNKTIIKAKNIGVVDDFIYMNLIPKFIK